MEVNLLASLGIKCRAKGTDNHEWRLVVIDMIVEKEYCLCILGTFTRLDSDKIVTWDKNASNAHRMLGRLLNSTHGMLYKEDYNPSLLLVKLLN